MPLATDPIPTPPPGAPSTPETPAALPRPSEPPADLRPTPEDQAVETERRELESGEESAAGRRPPTEIDDEDPKP